MWVYDLRTNLHFTQKANPIKRSDLDEFVACFMPGHREDRWPTWSHANPDGRWRVFDHQDLLRRENVNLDITWLADKELNADLPELDLLVHEIMTDLQLALEQFATIVEKIEK